GWSHTLSATVKGGTIFGPPQDEFFDFYIGGLPGMRGYPFYALGGNEYAMANLTYRVPIFQHIDIRILQMYFATMYGAFYGDIGNVTTTGNPNHYSDPDKLKRDVGFELRLESFSYYAFPTRIFFSATYGLDQFSREVTATGSAEPFVTYGHEWDFHFGILF